MEMAESGYLYTVAILGMTFIGFSAIVMLLRQCSQRIYDFRRGHLASDAQSYSDQEVTLIACVPTMAINPAR